MAKRREPSTSGVTAAAEIVGRAAGQAAAAVDAFRSRAPASDRGGRRGNDGRSRGLDGRTGSCWFGCRRREIKGRGPPCAKDRTPRSSAGCEDDRPSQANDEEGRYASEEDCPEALESSPSLVDVRHKRLLGSTHLRVGKKVGPSVRTRPSLVLARFRQRGGAFRPPMSSAARPIRRPAASANRRAETNAGDVRPRSPHVRSSLRRPSAADFNSRRCLRHPCLPDTGFVP